MKKNCNYCGSIVEVGSATPTYIEVCCPACVAKIEETVLSQGLIVPAPMEFVQAEPIFEKYAGCSEEDFREAYENFKTFVEGYYAGFCGGHGYKYAPDEVQYPLIAEVCSYCKVDFFASLWKDYRVHYPAVSILAKEYFISPPGTRLEFLECQEVMRRLLYVYWLNKDFFDEAKTLSENPRENPVPYEDKGKLTLEIFRAE